MNIQKIVLSAGETMKPALKKIFPQRFLQYVKMSVIRQSYKKMVAEGRDPFDKEAYPDGINLIGLIRAEMGLGQSARLLARELEATGMAYSLYNFVISEELMRTGDHSLDDKIREDLPYNINLIHINPDEMTFLYTRLDRDSWSKRYNIAFWLWELEEIPAHWQQAFPMLDEIWTPSEFISNNLRKVTDLPVYTVPYHVEAPVDAGLDRKHFGLPEDKFLFLVMYDSNSTMARKNPVGAIRAFRKAFKNNPDTGIVVKVNNPKPEELERLGRLLKDCPNVYYISETLTKKEVNSLISLVDVFVSLHRAEGFGLVMAEAMLLGTPCVATNWSSNTEFMNREVACMVDGGFTILKKDTPPYKKGARWAEPDITQAARYMRKLYKDPAYYNTIREKAKDYIRIKLSMKQAADLIRKRVEEIYDTEI